MGKCPPGFHKKTVHDGSSVSYSVLVSNPFYGLGKNAKPFATRVRRHYYNRLINEAKQHNQREAIPAILAIYRKG